MTIFLPWLPSNQDCGSSSNVHNIEAQMTTIPWIQFQEWLNLNQAIYFLRVCLSLHSHLSVSLIEKPDSNHISIFLCHHKKSLRFITEMAKTILTPSAASLAALNRLARCWFILALGATPSTWCYKLSYTIWEGRGLLTTSIFPLNSSIKHISFNENCFLWPIIIDIRWAKSLSFVVLQIGSCFLPPSKQIYIELQRRVTSLFTL